MARVLVIGGATLDTIIDYDQMESMSLHSPSQNASYLMLGEGDKIEVTRQQVFTGGGATNTAVSFIKQGHQVRIFCKVGQDLPGDRIVSELKEYGIDVDYVKRSQIDTATSFVVPSLSGDRTVFAYRGANARVLSRELSQDLIRQSDFIYITSLSSQSAARLPEICQMAKDLGVKVAINPGSSQLKAGSSFVKCSLGLIDALTLNFDEAKQLMAAILKSDDVMPPKPGQTHENELSEEAIESQDLYFQLKSFFKMMLGFGLSVVVVTHGSHGVYAATTEGLYYHRVEKIKAVNTLGAGDAFGSSFISAYYQGKGIAEALRWGVVNSSSVIREIDAKSGLLNQQDILQKAAKLNRAWLTEHKWTGEKDD